METEGKEWNVRAKKHFSFETKSLYSAQAYLELLICLLLLCVCWDYRPALTHIAFSERDSWASSWGSKSSLSRAMMIPSQERAVDQEEFMEWGCCQDPT